MQTSSTNYHWHRHTNMCYPSPCKLVRRISAKTQVMPWHVISSKPGAVHQQAHLVLNACESQRMVLNPLCNLYIGIVRRQRKQNTGTVTSKWNFVFFMLLLVLEHEGSGDFRLLRNVHRLSLPFKKRSPAAEDLPQCIATCSAQNAWEALWLLALEWSSAIAIH